MSVQHAQPEVGAVVVGLASGEECLHCASQCGAVRIEAGMSPFLAGLVLGAALGAFAVFGYLLWLSWRDEKRMREMIMGEDDDE